MSATNRPSAGGAATAATATAGPAPFCFKAASMEYVDRALKSKPGLKALLLDEETRNALAIGYSQHDLLTHEVVLVDLLNKLDRPSMPYLKCVVVCRPTASSINDISNLLMMRPFSEYHFVFTNFVEITQLEALVNAEGADAVVKSIEELYLDTTPVTDDVAIVPLSSSMFTAGNSSAPRNPLKSHQWEPSWVHRVCQGITSMALTLKRRPIVRYRAGSKICEKIGAELGGKAQSLAVQFPDLRANDCVVLIIDRMDDPITPLLTQWTYEAMVHELIGVVDGNKVVVSAEAAGTETLLDRTHLLDPVHDAFFSKHRYEDFGAICLAVRDLVESYKALNNIDRSTASLEEIKNFVARMPDAKQDSMIMTRHASLVGMISDAVKNRNLAGVSLVEQDVISQGGHADHSKAVLELVADPATDIVDALRLVLIYALRYEKNTSNIIDRLKSELTRRGLPDDKVILVDRMLEYAGAAQRVGDLFATPSIVKSISGLIPGFSDEVSNVLTQHTPWLKKIITNLYNNTLSATEYPYAGPVASAPTECRNIIVFMVGGATYEEAKLVNEINARKVDNKTSTNQASKIARAMTTTIRAAVGQKGAEEEAESPAVTEPPTAKIEARVVLGSTALLNSKLFLESLA